MVRFSGSVRVDMKQTLRKAVYQCLTGRGLREALQLDGCPVGGWPETEQAWNVLLNALPVRDLRSYTVNEFVDAVYRVDSAHRYRARTLDEALRSC